MRSPSWAPRASPPRLVELAQKYQPVGEIVQAAPFAVGHCLGHSANVIAGQNVVVGGAFKDDDADWIMKHIETGYRAATTPAVFEDVKLVTGSYTGSAAVAGRPHSRRRAVRGPIPLVEVSVPVTPIGRGKPTLRSEERCREIPQLSGPSSQDVIPLNEERLRCRRLLDSGGTLRSYGRPDGAGPTGR
jgi:hypothetical protein